MDTPNLKSAQAQAKSHASKAANHPAVVAMARVGFLVSGVLHMLIGYIALKTALGSGGGEASQSGALAEIASTPGGRVLLWVMVVAVAALALWRFTQLFVAAEAKEKAKGGVLGVTFASLAMTAATFAAGGSKSDGDKAADVTATALSLPAGRILVILAGLVVIGVGVYGIYKGSTQKFKEDLEAGASGGNVGSAIVVAGTVGYAARGVAFLVLGGLIAWAAVKYDPEQAAGLDAALRTIGEQPFGSVLLCLVALGFVAYGLYSVARAKYTSEVK